MNPGHHDQRGTADRRAEDATMETFTVRLPRWPILLKLRGRDPLVRPIDRIEALAAVVAAVVALFAVPTIAAVGTASYDSNRRAYSAQADTRQTVTATVIDVPAHQQVLRTGKVTAQARWMAGGGEHTGTVKAQSTTETGDAVEIWIDDDGTQVPAPPSTTRAAVEAALGAFVIWTCVAATAAAVFTLTRSACDRVRFRRWQHELDGLLGYGDSHTNER